ncbi:MAG: L-2-hydroxyglutarate oxidase [Candidatus Omnitrophota bacterium]
MKTKYQYIIIGSGIIGLTIAWALRRARPGVDILIVEKENDAAQHSSGRNSGILHAGFYYSADSLKAQFTVAGNNAMKDYCRAKDIPVNDCGKLVVAQNESELEQLYELERRGKRNGSNVEIISAERAAEIEPNVRTYQKALYSPDTASVDPLQVCLAIKDDLLKQGVDILFGAEYLRHSASVIQTTRGEFSAEKIINCSGLYADKIAQDFGFGRKYTMIPFKGLYLKYTKNKTDIRINIYPVPNLLNPFLGVHFTKTVDGSIKIGPTAIPAFWRENYAGLENFHLPELLTILCFEAKLFLCNSFGFRDLAFEEMRKYYKRYFINLAKNLVQDIDPKGFTAYTRPGIRAQLLDKETSFLVQDFVIEGDAQSIHVLNAVSPALTCSFPFADFVVKKHVLA